MTVAGILILLTIGLPWVGAVCSWWAGDARPKVQHTLAVLFSSAAGLAALALIPQASSRAAIVIQMGTGFGIFTFVPDGLGVFLAVIATVIGALAVIFSIDYMHGEAQLGRYYALVLFFIGAMAGLVLTGSLLLMFIFWEITALCSYALISFHNDDPKAVAGGMKALIITQLGGVGLLAGAMLVYVYTGSFEVNQLLNGAGSLPSGVLAVLAFGFLAAAAAKSAQFPFQTWLPDAMEAPTPVSALIHAATMVNAGVYLLARFFPAFETVPGWREAVMILGMLSALLSAIMALNATDLKRVLAYSTVSQLGFMVYAVGAGGVFAAQFHLLSHAVFKALLFLAAGAVIHSVGTRDMRLMGGLGKRLPLVCNVFIIGSLALAGLPVLNGFWSKELVLEAGLHGGPLWIFAFMLLTVGLTACYTLRCVWLVFFGEPRTILKAHATGIAMRFALIPLAAGAFLTWLLAGPFGQWLHASLPFHEIDPASTWAMVEDIFSAPTTLIALAVIACGLAGWIWRAKLVGLIRVFSRLNAAANHSFGFEAINRGVVQAANSTSEVLRGTQTGLLAWNVLGILLGLVAVLVLLLWGA